MKSKTRNRIVVSLGFILSALYFPIYLAAVICIKVLRALLAIPYLLVGDWRKSRDIFKYMFDKDSQ